jgi:hypothetical protein
VVRDKHTLCPATLNVHAHSSLSSPSKLDTTYHEPHNKKTITGCQSEETMGLRGGRRLTLCTYF